MLTIHDTRKRDPVANILGPYIIGDSIDIWNNNLLTGSYRSKDCLEVWDLRTYDRLNVYNWIKEYPKRGGQVTSAKFSKGKADSIIATGKATNDLRIFDRKTGEAIAGMEGFKSMIYSADVSYEGNFLGLGCADGSVYLLEYD